MGAEQAIVVGHSVSAIVALLGAIEAPGLIDDLVLVGPPPCYINDGDYIGGFEREDIEQMLELLDSNHLGWTSALAPTIMGNPELAAIKRYLQR